MADPCQEVQLLLMKHPLQRGCNLPQLLMLQSWPGGMTLACRHSMSLPSNCLPKPTRGTLWMYSAMEMTSMSMLLF